MCRHWLWCQCLLDKSSNTTRGQLQRLKPWSQYTGMQFSASIDA
jgi:hypothetical protein